MWVIASLQYFLSAAQRARLPHGSAPGNLQGSTTGGALQPCSKGNNLQRNLPYSLPPLNLHMGTTPDLSVRCSLPKARLGLLCSSDTCVCHLQAPPPQRTAGCDCSCSCSALTLLACTCYLLLLLLLLFRTPRRICFSSSSPALP